MESCKGYEDMSKNDFVLVTRKNRRKGSKCKKNIIPDFKSLSLEDDVEVDSKQFIQKLQTLIVELASSDYVADFKKILKIVLQKFSAIDLSIVCYGLGKFVSSKTARYQLAFLKTLKDVLDIEVYIYDPIFSEKEIEILMSLSFSVLSHNEEAKRTVTQSTIFYMPHCEHYLYNNLLWANWSAVHLQNVLIIGNSLKGISENIHEAKKHKFICRCTDFLDEISVPNSFRFKDIFSDTYIHIFDHQKLLSVSHEVWLDKEEPNLL